MSVIIGISHSHNGSVALISDGEVKSAIQGERISRQKRKSLRFKSMMGVDSKVLKNDPKLTQDCINYCLDASGFKHSDIEVIAISTPWQCHRVTNSELFKYIGGTPKKYTKTFYVPHHYAHMEYIAHYGDLKPGIILVIDGSGSLESDRSILNIKEKYDSKITNYTHFAGKEVVSAYWFDGFKSTLIYRFSPSISPAEDYNKDANNLYQSIPFGNNNNQKKDLLTQTFKYIFNINNTPYIENSEKIYFKKLTHRIVFNSSSNFIIFNYGIFYNYFRIFSNRNTFIFRIYYL